MIKSKYEAIKIIIEMGADAFQLGGENMMTNRQNEIDNALKDAGVE